MRLIQRSTRALKLTAEGAAYFERVAPLIRGIEDAADAHACLRYVTAGGPYPRMWADGTALVPDGPFDTDDGAVLRQAALSGAGIAQLSEMAVAEDIRAGKLALVLPDLPTPGLDVHAVHAFGRQVPVRVRLFIEFLEEQFAASAAKKR